MGALTPSFLLAALAVGVPLWLHLFHRHETRRISFPALRYLERTERDHARRIRLRQLLLMLIRAAVLLLVVGAGARLFFRGRGAAHPPTAVVMVLDNSMSSGLVVGETRVLESLKDLAYRALDAANPEDRIWILRAGEPWVPAVPTGPERAREIVGATEVSMAAGDLNSAMRRAAEILSTSPLQAREIHLLSDLQRTAFGLGQRPDVLVPVVASALTEVPAANRSIADVVIGGGLPPLEGQRSELTVRVGATTPGDTVPVGVRVLVEGRIRGAAAVPPGSATSVSLPPTGSGWIRGWVETDADALRADDRHFFAFQARPAPVVALGGDVPLFLEESVNVLVEAERIRRSGGGVPDLLVSASGVGLGGMGVGAAVLIVPPEDPTLLPALNRRLADAGIPWRYAVSDQTGEDVLRGTRVPEALEGTQVRRWYDLVLDGAPPAPPQTLARIGRMPWLVEGDALGGGRYLLLASPLDPASSTLPVSTAMVRFLDWSSSQWAAQTTGATSRPSGLPLSAPRRATHLRLPSDTVVEIDGSRAYRATAQAGFYEFLEGDSVLAVEALNPPSVESDLAPMDAAALEGLLGDRLTLVDDPDRWVRATFRERQGPELWWPLLMAALLLLALEAVLAASGRAPQRGAAAARGGAVDA